MFDVNKVREDFPILKRKINGKDLHYLDNAATSQKPQVVIDSISDYYSNHNANVHRGIHTLSEEATDLYENARKEVQKFINARYPEEIVFTKGTTDSINLVSSAVMPLLWDSGKENAGDEMPVISFTEVEHHSNLVPWQELAKRASIKLEPIPVTGKGFLDGNPKDLFSKNMKILAITHASNFLGSVLPLKDIIKTAHSVGSLVVVDGAQAIPHMKVDVQSLNCDFYAFSGHKMLGPTGIGVLYIKKEIQEKLGVYQTGGGMIREVYSDRAVWDQAPYKFEAGTPNVEGAVGLMAAITYLKGLGMDSVRDHELSLIKYSLEKLTDLGDIDIYGPENAEDRTGVISFNVKGIHSHDLASVLDSEGVAIRSGHHCTMPMHLKLAIPASARMSFNVYSTKDDVDALISGIEKARKILL